MAKRFTDTGKWGDKWFYSLSPYAKLLFDYLCDNCDNAGFYEINEERLARDTGIPVHEIPGCFSEVSRSAVIVNGWVWLKNFLRQQKNLPINPKNNAHAHIVGLFEERGKHFVENSEFIEFLDKLPEATKEKIRRFEPLNRGPGKGNGIGNGNGNVISFESEENFSLPTQDGDSRDLEDQYRGIIAADKKELTRHQRKDFLELYQGYGEKLEGALEVARHEGWRSHASIVSYLRGQLKPKSERFVTAKDIKVTTEEEHRSGW